MAGGTSIRILDLSVGKDRVEKANVLTNNSSAKRMGNCCDGESQEPNSILSNGQKTKAFHGEGRRLGTSGEQASAPKANSISRPTGDDIPAPVRDPTMTDADREKQRADRLAAVEARMKKQGGSPAKKKASSNEPLRGPNSQPAMRWNL